MRSGNYKRCDRNPFNEAAWNGLSWHKIGWLLTLAVIGYLVYTRYQPYHECTMDGEGSWAVGMFTSGDQPFKWDPIEISGMRLFSKTQSGIVGAGIANPIFSCRHSAIEMNFVADPFLYQPQPGSSEWYLYFEQKTRITAQGDIGVAISKDNGITWRYKGIALDEPFHLSYPYVFSHEGELYMIPESSGGHSIRLYKASPDHLKFVLDTVLIEAEKLVDSSIVYDQASKTWFMLTSPSNSELHMYFADNLRGPWTASTKNPIIKGRLDKARNGGRILNFGGAYYRFGQNSTLGYGGDLQMYRITEMTRTSYAEEKVSSFALPRTHWNAKRFHHMDAHLLLDGKTWVSVTDGDREFGYSALLEQVKFYFLCFVVAATLTGIFAWGFGCASKEMMTFCVFKQKHRVHGRRSLTSKKVALGAIGLLVAIGCLVTVMIWFDPLTYWVHDNVIYNNDYARNFRAWDEKTKQYAGFHVMLLTHGHTPDVLYRTIDHFAQCPSSVGVEIVYNVAPGIQDPPNESRLTRLREKHGIPIFVRTETENHVANRYKQFKMPSWSNTVESGAVLSVDRDVRIPCFDVERAFQLWLSGNQDRIVGFYPRLISKCRDHFRYGHLDKIKKKGRYNVILPGAAFMRADFLHTIYQTSPKVSRDLVDEVFNCDDILLNFAWANQTRQSPLYFDGIVMQAPEQDSLKQRSNHHSLRVTCIAKFTHDFNNITLPHTHYPHREYVDLSLP